VGLRSVPVGGSGGRVFARGIWWRESEKGGASRVSRAALVSLA
jgi:hypothetical protein